MNHKLNHGVRIAMLAIAATTAVSVLATPAHAAGNTAVAKSSNILKVTAASGTVNDIRVSRSLNGQFFNVTDVAVSPGSGCQSTGVRSVQCSAAGITEINISAGDGDDRVILSTNTFARVLGGTGNDTLISSNSAGEVRLSGNDGDDRIFGADFDSLFGQNGNDLLSNGRLLVGGADNDVLRGFDGNDVLTGDAGFDNLDGGEGFDDQCLTAELTTGCEAFS